MVAELVIVSEMKSFQRYLIWMMVWNRAKLFLKVYPRFQPYNYIIDICIFPLRGNISISVLTKLHILSNLLCKMHMYGYLLCRFFRYFLLQVLDYIFLFSTKMRILWGQGECLITLYFSGCQSLRCGLLVSNPHFTLCLVVLELGPCTPHIFTLGSQLGFWSERVSEGDRDA